MRRTKKINLNVPAGVDTGSRLRVRGEGSAGRKGELRLWHRLAPAVHVTMPVPCPCLPLPEHAVAGVFYMHAITITTMVMLNLAMCLQCIKGFVSAAAALKHSCRRQRTGTHQTGGYHQLETPSAASVPAAQYQCSASWPGIERTCQIMVSIAFTVESCS